jgi:hypothetical protein
MTRLSGDGSLGYSPLPPARRRGGLPEERSDRSE